MSENFLFSDTELWFLFSSFAPCVVIGFADPTLGLLSSELQLLRSESSRHLVQRSMIKIEAGQTIISESLARLLIAITNPKHTIIAALQLSDSKVLTRSFHMNENDIVELYEYKPHHYSIGTLSGRGGVKQWIHGSLPITSTKKKDGQPFRLLNSVLDKARRCVAEGNLKSAEEFLAENGLSAPQIKSIMPALRSPTASLSVTSFLYRNSQDLIKARGFALLVTDHDLWLIQPENEANGVVLISSISQSRFQSEIDRIIP